MRELHAVGADYPFTGPNQNTLTQPLGVASAVLFRCLTDGPAWKEWLGIDVEWTSPEPFGVGTTRTVTANGQRIEEMFFTWEQDKAMGFRFDRTTLPVAAFAEHYACDATGEGRCLLRWSYAYEWGGPLEGVLGRAFGAFFEMNAKRSLNKLATLLENETHRWESPEPTTA